MEYVIRPAGVTDKDAVIEIFNHFIRHSLAAYMEKEFDDNAYVQMVESIGGMPFLVVEVNKKVTGFGFARPYYPDRAFARTAVLTYYILQEFTGIGIGTNLFETIVGELKKLGVDTLLASISHANEQSIAFHRKMGFFECGRLKRVCRKKNKDIDIIWMEKML